MFKFYIGILIFINAFSQLFCMEPNKQKLNIYAIPGQNGLGSEDWYIEGLFEKDCTIIPVRTPSKFPDLGQMACLKHLRDSITKNKEKGIIHATSQGTATAINYVAHEDCGKHIKGLILEATLASGNTAIEHTLKGPLMNLPFITKLPFSYYWLPYLAKFVFPLYWPSGKQPIKSISKIPNDLPVIIVHSKHDPQLSYDDACALYYSLRSAGNKNAYLITKSGGNHVNLVMKKEDKKIIQSILKKHRIIEDSEQNDVDLTSYQPDHKIFETQYREILAKERNHEIISYSCAIGAGFLLAKYMKSCL